MRTTTCHFRRTHFDSNIPLFDITFLHSGGGNNHNCNTTKYKLAFFTRSAHTMARGVQTWSAAEVTANLAAQEWADALLVTQFQEHEIDGASLLELTKRDLREDFGVRELGKIKKILSGIAKLCRNNIPSSAPTRRHRKSDTDIVNTTKKSSQKSSTRPRARSKPHNHIEPPSAPPTPDLENFDVPISAEDLKGTTATYPPSDEELRAAPIYPQPPRPAPPSPTALAAAPPARIATSYDVIEIGEEDTIELSDLMPENARGGDIDPDTVPARPVTAIGHRPIHGVDEDHRHVWADDPAVHIRHASDLLHDSSACPHQEIISPEDLRQLKEPPQKNMEEAVTKGRRSPIPRPPACMGVPLPSGMRTPGWVQDVFTPAESKRAADTTHHAPLHLLGSPAADQSRNAAFVIDLNAPPHDNGILEQERRYSELQQLFTVWVTGESADGSDVQRFIEFKNLSGVLQRFCGWKEEEAATNGHMILNEIDDNNDGRLDWHEFFVFMSRISRGMPPTAFDGMVGTFTSCILGEQREREDARRKTLLCGVWAELGSSIVEVRRVRELAQGVSDEEDSAAFCRHVASALSGEDGEEGGTLTADEFEHVFLRAAEGMSSSDFDLLVFRLKSAAVVTSKTDLGCPQLSSEELEGIVALSPSSSPLVIVGSAVDPSRPLAECAASCGVTLRIFLISSDATSKAALSVTKNSGFARGEWVCVSVDPKYKDSDAFLRSLGVLLQTGSPWSIHRKFRLWIHVCGNVQLPSVLSVRSVVIDVEKNDLKSLKQSLELQANRTSGLL